MRHLESNLGDLHDLVHGVGIEQKNYAGLGLFDQVEQAAGVAVGTVLLAVFVITRMGF